MGTDVPRLQELSEVWPVEGPFSLGKLLPSYQRIVNFLEAAQALSEDELRHRRDTAQQRLQELEVDLDAATEAEAAAQRKMEAARATSEKLMDFDAASQAFEKVQSRRAEIDLMRENAAAARRAEKLLDLEHSLRDRNQEYARAREESATRLRERDKAEQEEQVSRERLVVEEGRSGVRVAVAQDVQRLSDLRTRVEKIVLAEVEVQAAEAEHEKEAGECELLETRLRDLTANVQTRDEQIATLQSAAQRADFLWLSGQRSQGLLQNRQRLDQVDAAAGEAGRQLEEARASYSNKNEELQQTGRRSDHLQSEWLAAQAAVLAAKLSDGIHVLSADQRNTQRRRHLTGRFLKNRN
jgi:hypothetical protein